MPNIAPQLLFTVMVEWDVDATNQREFAIDIADTVRQHFPGRPGFVSATFHVGHGGRRVVNYAQWRSREDWQGGTRDPDDVTAAVLREPSADDVPAKGDPAARPIDAVMRRHGATTVSVETFDVESVVEPEPEDSLLVPRSIRRAACVGQARVQVVGHAAHGCVEERRAVLRQWVVAEYLEHHQAVHQGPHLGEEREGAQRQRQVGTPIVIVARRPSVTSSTADTGPGD